MTSDQEHLRYLFGQACKEGDLVKAQKFYNDGVGLEPVLLGISVHFQQDLSVFEWLLDVNCPVGGDTWLYIAGSNNSHIYTRRIYEKTHCNLQVAGIHAADNLDREMLAYVVSVTGWSARYLENIKEAECYNQEPSIQAHHREFVAWVTSQIQATHQANLSIQPVI